MGQPRLERSRDVTLLWIIIIVLAVIGLLALLSRGRLWGTRP
jgi:flagellar basal body-associated protein FliL